MTGALRARPALQRYAGTIALAALLLAAAASASASASTGTLPGSARAAAVQTVLDRVLGPGNSTVVVSDTVRTSASTTTSVRWGSGVPVATASSATTVPGIGTTRQSGVQNAVGGTTTAVATPPGALVDQTVAVAVDRAHLGANRVATLRRLVASAAGIVPARGDRLSLVVARFARPVVAPVPQPTLLALLLPEAVPAIWVAGALLALLVLISGIRRSRSGARA